MPQTQLVAINELLKVTVFCVWAIVRGEITNIKWSLWYALPALVYAVNNNIFYKGLQYVPPPVWNILIQTRLVFTALAYHIVFNKRLLRIQWFALFLIMVSVIIVELPSGSEDTDSLYMTYGGLSTAACLAIVGSATSVIGTLTMEYLFKNDAGTFCQKQLQLYSFGCVISWVLCLLESSPSDSHTPQHSRQVIMIPDQDYDDEENDWFLYPLVGVSMLLTLASGVAVAVIVKKLDNIVKLYTQAISNILMSFVCAYLFPEFFSLSPSFLLSLLVMMAAVFLYENKGLTMTSRSTDPFLPVKVKSYNR